MRLNAIITLSAVCFGVCIAIAAQMSVQAAMPQGRAGQNGPPQPAPKEMTAPDIPGVIRGGTKVTLLRDGFNGTEAVITMR